MNNNSKSSMTKMDKFKSYSGSVAVLLPSIGALAVSLATAFRGEPVAEKTWSTLREQVNVQSSAINSVQKRLIEIQAREEGRSEAQLILKIEKLQEIIHGLETSSTGNKKPEDRQITSSSIARVTCDPGWILSHGKCMKVPKNLTVAVKDAFNKAEVSNAKLRLEKLLRKEEESKRKSVELKIRQASKPNSKFLRALPSDLEAASKK